MKWFSNPSTDPYFNMSFDEYCLQACPSEDNVFYLWRNRPSVIIGLNQNAYGEVNLDYLREHDIALARRVTGGGAVYHDLQNLNYTFVGRGVTPQPFVDALRSLGLDAELTGRNDIYVGGRKVSGYARRVWHDREIVHGTLMYDVDIDTLTKVLDVPGSKMASKGISSVRARVANLKDEMPQFASLDALQAALHEILADGDKAAEMPSGMLQEVQRMADEKFSTWEWIYGHSHEADFVRKARLSCGTVEIAYTLDRGRIASLNFGGDFLGSLPSEQLAAVLKGCRFERETLLNALEREGTEQYFENTGPEEVLYLFFTT